MKYILTFLLLLFGLTETFAQYLIYDSLYTIREELVGHAKFEYKVDGLSKVSKEGPFHFNYENIEYEKDLMHFKKETWTGEFEDDKKVGRWLYHRKNSSIQIQGFEGRDLQYFVETKIADIKAKYKEGIPEGDWEYLGLLIDEKSMETVTEDIQVSFLDGKFHGDIFCTLVNGEDSVTINGYSDEGLLEGSWIFKFNDHFEERKYERGVLLELIDMHLNGDTIKHIVYPLSNILKEVLKNSNTEIQSSGTLIFNDGYVSNSNLIKSQIEGNQVLVQMIELLLKNDETSSGKKFIPLGIYRHTYPFTESEKIALLELDSLFESYQFKLHLIKNEDIIDLAYSDDFLTRRTINWLNKEIDFVEYMNGFFGENIQHTLSKIHRDGVIVDTLRSHIDTSKLMVDSHMVILNFNNKTIHENNLISYLVNNFEARHLLADSFYNEFKIKIESMLLDTALILKNRRIISLFEMLDSNIINKENDPLINDLITRLHDNYLDHIVNMEYQEFLDNAQDKQHQIQLGDSILQELHSIEEIYSLIGEISSRRLKIDELYTEYVFDPFTYTDSIPSRIKRKLYELICTEMFKQFISIATNSSDPFTCLNHLEELYEIQGYMFELKERKTRKLESQLRKEKDLDIRIKILNKFLE